MSDLLLRGGRPWGFDGSRDILVRDAVIERIEPEIDVDDAEVVDVSARIVLPGLVDAHCHLDKTLYGGPWVPHSAGDALEEPDTDIVQLSVGLVTDVSCFGASDGSISMNVSGSSPSYSFQWSNNDTLSSTGNLAPGNYTVIAIDAYGCSDTDTVAITQPVQLTDSLVVENISCSGNATGFAAAYPLGGVGPYSYSWNTSPPQSSASVNSLYAGSWEVTVTDDNGCQVTTNFLSHSQTHCLTF